MSDHKDLRADGFDKGLDVDESGKTKQMKMRVEKRDGISGGGRLLY